MTIELIAPLPVSWLPLVWAWLHEEPLANFADGGPETENRFAIDILQRQRAGERTWGVTIDTVPSGFIGYLPISARLGTFHGICFRHGVCGLGGPRAAVGRVLETLFAEGVEKVCATYFADNGRVRAFLAKLGAVDEGLLRDHVIRQGAPVSMHTVAIFNPARARKGAA